MTLPKDQNLRSQLIIGSEPDGKQGEKYAQDKDVIEEFVSLLPVSTALVDMARRVTPQTMSSTKLIRSAEYTLCIAHGQNILSRSSVDWQN